MKTYGKLILGMLVFIGMLSSLADAQQATSFEKTKAGVFDTLKTAIGTWTSEVGRTTVDNKHAKSGTHCLQLTGGSRTSMVLQIADQVETSGNLTFWAERWTKRSPFSFRIDKYTGDSWKEIFNGDTEVRVGRAFLSQITVPLNDTRIKQLRFTATSPPNTGILIDDIRIAPIQPQTILSVEVVPFSLPACVGRDASPLLKLKVETTGTLNPISLTALKVTLDGTTDRSDVTLVSVYATGSNNRFMVGESLVQIDGRRLRRGPFELSCAGPSCQLVEGVNHFWVTGKISQGASIDGRIGAVCKQVQFSNGEQVTLDANPLIQRMGVAVRQGGDDGVHTYRIPGLATTKKGTLIGVYDIRHRKGGDLPGDINVGMSRSTDGGQTWEPMQVIMDMGHDPDFHYDGIGDPAVLVDQNTGAIWVAATWSHGNRSWRGSGPGMKPEETGQLMLARSDDDGVTWSRPINITEQVKDPKWCFILQGPGKGITMRDGTLVFAAQYQDSPEQQRLPHSTLITSQDHGTTWQVGTGAFDDTTESQVVEIEPGVLMLNCRYNRKPVRVVMTTRDMGKTWQKHPTSERSLIEPGACMASLIDVDRERGKDAGAWLLFSNPDSTQGRHHITIKASPDRGLTWPRAHRLLLDEGNGAGYSCMSMIDDKTVGILYEGSQAHMTFQRIPLSDLVGEPVRPQESSAQSLLLPPVFGNHMVLQADAPIPVWGHAISNAQVTVTLGRDIQRVRANEQGAWQVRLNSRVASDNPATMVIQSGDEQIEFTDVLVGEVWVCAGQSNMEWTLSQSIHGKEELFAVEYPRLRLLHLSGGARGSSGGYTSQHLARLSPELFCQGQWTVASRESASSFSAVGWYFGRCLQQALNRPVGLICPAVGGTPTEAWIPREALEADPALKGLVAGNWLDNKRLGEFCRTRGEQNLLQAMQAGDMIPGDEFGPNHSFKPGFMWSAGIEPLIPYAIRGAIWYQGESNAETPARVREHGRLFPLLIEQWRTRWKQGDFPFLYVQLPALNRSEWPWFREGQRRLLNQLKHVGMAITLDTGLPTNVHPPLKKPVGERLAKWALGTTYHQKSHRTYSGPLVDASDRDGHTMVISFEQVGMGLKSADGRSLRHFEICGNDGVFQAATAKITGKHTIAVSSGRVNEPTHVRYAWLPFPDLQVNLVNSAGLPASPFSSEDTEAKTHDVFTVGQETVKGEDQQDYAQFREQNVIVTKSGRIVVICQGRNKGKWSDRSGQDLVCKWSDDQGKTWANATLIKTHGRQSICPNAAVYDEQTQEIHVLYNLFLWDYRRVPGDVQGEVGDLHCRQYVVTSGDEGQTWSSARDITDMVDTHGAVMVVGSGEGIQLKHGPAKGRLLVAGGDFYQGKKVLCFYSDDHGQTWQRSREVPWKGNMSWASESKVAELSDGTVVLNSRTFVRNESKQRLRTSAYSRDGGLTWIMLTNCPDLKTVSCNGSLLAVPHARGATGTVLLCSVPVGPGRTHGTLYVSFDNGKTWPHSRVVVPEEFAYSSLVCLPGNTIGLFYEAHGHKDIRMARFSLEWLLGGRE